jgi:hypothetical protein
VKLKRLRQIPLRYKETSGEIRGDTWLRADIHLEGTRPVTITECILNLVEVA